MPIYKYGCEKCGSHVEVIQKISDPPLKRCAKCRGKLAKAVSRTSFQLKGSGWYATDYPAAVGPHMTNTDSTPFMDLVPAISLRENERGREIGAGWDPQWHQPTDVYATYSDADFRLGLNAAQTTLGAIGRLTGATLTR